MHKNVQNNSIKYRADIDGLRAIAVLAVVLFHFFPEKLSGGFAGVDVFFVISGYLVTGILQKNLTTNSFSLGQFYIKRIRRLFPGLIAVLLTVFTAGYILLPSEEFAQLGKHLLSSAFFSTNIVLFRESGYFDTISDLKPLLHLWSLCIEEQFYLLWPLIICIFGSRKNGTFKALWVIMLLSLTASALLTQKHPAFSFYLLPTRTWELALGGLLALWEDRPTKIIMRTSALGKFLQKIDVSIIGVAVLVFSFKNLDKNTEFPGVYALLPVIATALLIAAGPRALVNKVIAYKPIVYVGLLSYPLYLWHWPLISFANILTSGVVGINLRILLISISLILAALTYEFIEKPSKKLPNTKLTAISKYLALLTLGLAGFYIWDQKGLPYRHEDIEKIIASKEAFKSARAPSNSKTCAKIALNAEFCFISDDNKEPTVALIGDSHANHLFPGLKSYYDTVGENLILLAKSGTPPLLHVVSKRGPDQSLDDIFRYIKQTNSVHTVILSAFWGNYFEQEGIIVSGTPYKNIIEDTLNTRIEKQSEIFEKSLNRTLKFLMPEKTVLFFYDTPSLPFQLGRCLPRPFINKPKNCEFAIETELEKQKGYRQVTSPILEQFKVKSFDPIPILCNKSCGIIMNGNIMYSDEHHLSIVGSNVLIKQIFQ